MTNDPKFSVSTNGLDPDQTAPAEISLNRNNL